MPAEQDYVFRSIEFDADREFKDPIDDKRVKAKQPLELKKMCSEVNLFEDILKGYLTANLVISDDGGFFSQVIELQGTERLRIQIEGTEGNVGTVIDLNMKVVSILREAKINDRASTYLINAISDHGYRDSLAKVNRSYTDHLEDISEKVLKSYLNIDVSRDSKYFPEGEESIQGDIKVLVPYISPLECTQWLLERATDRKGFPLFAWASMWDQNEVEGKIRLGMLRQMMKKGVESAQSNKDRQWLYGQGMPARREPTSKRQRRTIISYENNNRENTLSMIDQGTVGSRITNLDTYTSQEMDRHFSLQKLIEEIREDAPEMKGIFSTIYDEEHEVEVGGENKTTAEHESRHRNLVTSFGTYQWNNSYHDVFDPSLLVNKMKKSAILSALNKNVMDVTLSGYNFLQEKLSVGDIIGLKFHTQVLDEEGASKLRTDERASGYYLLLKTRNVFSGTQHRTVVSCAKISDWI